jgi:hypothetical protein
VTGCPFDITVHDIVIPEVCPALKIPIKANLVRMSDSSPSLDKLIPSLGYTKQNIWIISNRANRIKNDSTLAELKQIVSAVEERISGHTDFHK